MALEETVPGGLDGEEDALRPPGCKGPRSLGVGVDQLLAEGDDFFLEVDGAPEDAEVEDVPVVEP